MARVDVRLARRIDRLARAAHRFHRFAHHPLCDEYGGEVVRLGRRNRVCRGCLFVGLGGLAGLLASVSLYAPLPILLLLGTAGFVGLVVTILSRSRGPARAPKLLSRLLPALAIAYALGHAVQFGVAGCALAAVSAASLFVVVAIYRRRGPDRTPCATCAERNLETPCRGIAPVVRRERAFRRLAGHWLDRVGP